jgi:hypothetical protein
VKYTLDELLNTKGMNEPARQLILGVHKEMQRSQIGIIAAWRVIRSLLDEKHCGELNDDALDELVIEMLDAAVDRLCEGKHEGALQ